MKIHTRTLGERQVPKQFEGCIQAKDTCVRTGVRNAESTTHAVGRWPLTVLAPTDAAFAAALEALGLTAEELLASPDLADILTYHVIPGENLAEAVIGLDGQDVATVNGATVAISVVDGSVMINDATVTTADVPASNGVIHMIDRVLPPPA